MASYKLISSEREKKKLFHASLIKGAQFFFFLQPSHAASPLGPIEEARRARIYTHACLLFEFLV
jgi:hypothetical protein